MKIPFVGKRRHCCACTVNEMAVWGSCVAPHEPEPLDFPIGQNSRLSPWNPSFWCKQKTRLIMWYCHCPFNADIWSAWTSSHALCTLWREMNCSTTAYNSSFSAKLLFLWESFTRYVMRCTNTENYRPSAFLALHEKQHLLRLCCLPFPKRLKSKRYSLVTINCIHKSLTWKEF